MTDRDHIDGGTFERYRELRLLEALESNPETSQADLATRTGVAVGTVNWYLKRWSAKGLVKVKRIGRWRWRYILTPQGLAEKADLANRYFQASMRIYRQTREEAKRLLGEVQAAGYESVIVEGDGDIAEIIELTCLQMAIAHSQAVAGEDPSPRILVSGLDLTIKWPERDTGLEQGP